MNPARPYPIQETFYSWQGEGDYSGRAAHFIRLYGCPLRCPWCDSAGTWHEDHRPAQLRRATAAELAAEAHATGTQHVIVTGGEPTIHNLEPLTAALRAAGLLPHLETSGAFPITGDWHHIVVSPKWNRPPLPEALAQANTIKLIIEDPKSLPLWEAHLGEALRGKTVYLNPEHSAREDADVLRTITEAVKANPHTYRAGWQLHKLFAADQHDPRSAPAVPLGGTGYRRNA